MNRVDPAITRELVEAYPTSTLRELSLRYQISHETVRRLLMKEGVKIRRKGEGPTYTGRPPLANALPFPWTEREVVAALLKGTSLESIAKFLKMKRKTVDRIARHNGLVLVRGEWRRS